MTSTLRSEDVEELLGIGTALAAERDLDTLLTRILEKSRYILSADAGSLYLAEGPSPDQPTHLRFKLAQNESISIELKEFLLPLNANSLAGYVATTRETILIEDVYQSQKEFPFHFNPEVDKKTGYRSKSVICVPMTDHQDQLIGVVQLLNKKRNASAKLKANNVDEEVVPFGELDKRLLSSLAAQAGVAIENARLYQDIRHLFKGFIRASVTAIEARDPTTSGHSERVSKLTIGLAEQLDQLDRGPYRDVKFSKESLQELEYAALLHDFGKIGVRESVLVKAKKLYPMELQNIRERFDALYRLTELEWSQKKIDHLTQGGKKGDATWVEIEKKLEKRLMDLEKFYKLIVTSNEPTVLPESVSNELQKLFDLKITRPDGSTNAVIQAEELRRLSIPKGSLSNEERLEIESHVTHTYQFLSRIPWTREFRNIPTIAHAHHEKLDGSGYPRKIKKEEIPLPSKIMTVADIFDALAARDRPYKRAVPVSKALDILNMEVREGKLDADLVHLFIDSKVYRLTSGEE